MSKIPNAYGDKGFDSITGSESRAKEWFAIHVVAGPATFSATSTVGDSVTAGTYAEGTVILGVFSAIVVTDGKVHAYRL